MWLVVGLIIVFAAGCAVKAYQPLTSVTDFWTDDPVLYQALVKAAENWTQAGVASASIITIELISGRGDEWKKKDRTPVVREERGKLYKLCKPSDPSYRGDGCTSIRDGKWRGIYIPFDLTDYGRVQQVVLHELGHILAQTKEHTPEDCVAVMHPNSTSATPTEYDIAFMKARTTVLDPKDLV